MKGIKLKSHDIIKIGKIIGFVIDVNTSIN